MHDHGSGSDPASEDSARERNVLMAVLEVHPAQINEAELVREYANHPHDLASRNGFSRAIDDLVRVGLLQRNGDFVLPTRAAVHIKELWGLLV